MLRNLFLRLRGANTGFKRSRTNLFAKTRVKRFENKRKYAIIQMFKYCGKAGDLFV